jgi:hypothetical protein
MSLNCSHQRGLLFIPRIIYEYAEPRAVPWLRRLVAGLSPRSPGFAPGSIHVGFVVDKVALGQVFLSSSFFPVSIIPPSFSILIYHLEDEQYVR